MKSHHEIEKRLKGLLCQELDRRIAEARSRQPHLCKHNYRHPLDHRKLVKGEANKDYNKITKKGLPVAQTIGLCMLGSEDAEEWNGYVCEDTIDAQRCPHFNPKLTVQDVYDRYLDDLETKTLSGEAKTLFWVLDSTGLRLPWWKRLWFKWVARTACEPLSVPVRDLSVQLLPPAEFKENG